MDSLVLIFQFIFSVISVLLFIYLIVLLIHWTATKNKVVAHNEEVGKAIHRSNLLKKAIISILVIVFFAITAFSSFFFISDKKIAFLDSKITLETGKTAIFLGHDISLRLDNLNMRTEVGSIGIIEIFSGQYTVVIDDISYKGNIGKDYNATQSFANGRYKVWVDPESNYYADFKVMKVK